VFKIERIRLHNREFNTMRIQTLLRALFKKLEPVPPPKEIVRVLPVAKDLKLYSLRELRKENQIPVSTKCSYCEQPYPRS